MNSEDFKRIKEIEAEGNKHKDIAFKSFMDQPTIRLLMSRLPATEPEILETLLKEAHGSGFSSGAAYTGIRVLENIISKSLRDK